jgi:hypothetical protein
VHEHLDGAVVRDDLFRERATSLPERGARGFEIRAAKRDVIHTPRIRPWRIASRTLHKMHDGFIVEIHPVPD